MSDIVRGLAAYRELLVTHPEWRGRNDGHGLPVMPAVQWDCNPVKTRESVAGCARFAPETGASRPVK
jgi:hypothetical protein